MKVAYTFLAPFNGINVYTTFDENKTLIDTYFPNGKREFVIRDLKQLGGTIITDENEAVQLGLNIFED